MSHVKGIRKRTVSSYILVRFARRLLLAFIIVNTDLVFAQLLFVMYFNQFFLMFVMYNNLYVSRRDQAIETINEIIILLSVYHLFCFSDFVSDVETRSVVVGYSMIFMTAINILRFIFD